jgi:KRAB domain-containing zinc finger protein
MDHESKEPVPSKISRIDGLKRQISVVHEGKKGKELCDVCNKGFTKKSDLRKHISAVHEGKKPYKCEICDKDFSQRGHLKGHISSVHEGKRPFQCSTCNIGFATKHTLKKHLAGLHGEMIESFDCKICFKKCGNMLRLKKHVSIVHEGERHYIC